MRTLLIDNYDSFTFNLFQYLAEINGEPPVVVPNDQARWSEIEHLGFDNIVISPGPGRPEVEGDFGFCEEVIRLASCPVLGVCLGHQGIALAFGGEIVHAPEPFHGRVSTVSHDGSELFQRIPRKFKAVRYHSLTVRTPLPEPLAPIAWTEDGVVMALRHRTRPIWGVQFHPESIATEHGKQLLRNFIASTPEPAPAKRMASPAMPPKPTPTQDVHWRRSAGFPDPEAVFHSLFGHRLNSFWLDGARFSYMGVGAERLNLTEGKVFDTLRQHVSRPVTPEHPLPFDFCGGYIGYFGYELKAECGAQVRHRSTLPGAAFLYVDRFLAFDHEERALYLVALDRPEWIDATARDVDAVAGTRVPSPGQLAPPSDIFLVRPRDRYLQDIRHCLRAIRDGESYEVCLTNKLVAAANPDPWDFYRHLRRANPVPYAAFLRFPELAVASSSPECFLRIGRDGWVETKPIKGTAPLSTSGYALATSIKNRAENLMIVDLLRNDLGRVCETGSISVPKMMDVESYATVRQLVSTVRGHLRAECSALDCIQAAFPGGSMTGAPKLRTMEILDNLETEARGIYSGALGYISFNGTCALSIVIRTAILTPGRVEIGAGGAITALSDPEAEFAEMVLKAESVANVFGDAISPRW